MLRRLLWACIAALTLPAFAQSAAIRDDSLYKAFGEKPGLEKLMDDFVNRMLADARLKPFFKDVKPAHLKEELVTQICEVAGGPCKREGADMKRVHEEFPITRADFDRLVEVLQDAMDAQGIAFTAQNRLLARLAPMHRDIVNAR